MPLPLGMARDIAARWPKAGGQVSVEQACVILTRLVSEAVDAEMRQGFMAKLKPMAHAAHVRRSSAGCGADVGSARALAAQACRAAALLQGRALLSSEALALLGAAGAACRLARRRRPGARQPARSSWPRCSASCA